MNLPPPVVRAGHPTGRVFLSLAMTLSLAATDAYSAIAMGGGVLKFGVTGTVTSDSNVFGDTTDQSDVVFAVSPQVMFDREGSRGTTHFDAGLSIDRFAEFSELNSEDNFSVNGAITMPQGASRLSGSLNLQYFNGVEVDDFVGGRVDINRLSFALSSSYLVSGRTSVRFGVNRNSFDAATRPSTSSTSLRGGVSLQLRQALDAFVDYSRTDTKTDTSPGVPTPVDFTSDSLRIGLDGQITAVLTGAISVGFESISASSTDTGGDDENVVAHLSLSWSARVNTTVGLSGGQSTRVTSNANAIDALTIAIDVEQKIGPKLDANVALLWETFETRGLGNQKDDRVAASLNLEYSANDRFSFGGGVSHNVRYSFDPQFDISRTTLSAFGSFTF